MLAIKIFGTIFGVILAVMCSVFFPKSSFPFYGFSTKTAYRHCGLQPFEDGMEELLKDCELVHINALFRHGTREPSEKDVVKFERLHKRLVTSGGAVLPEGFLDWPIPFLGQGNKQLLPTGFLELHNLGQHFKRWMENHFTFSESNVKFYSSSVNRSYSSARSFYQSMFDKSPLLELDPRVSDQGTCLTHGSQSIRILDRFLRFFDYCPRYKVEVLNNRSALLEYQLFKTGPDMHSVFEDFVEKHRLVKKEYEVDDVVTIFNACAFEVATSTNSSEDLSPWCKFLDQNHLPIIEYLLDLKNFWAKAYGYEINYIQSCPIVGKMMEEISQVAMSYRRHRGEPKNLEQLHRASFWFGHAETLLPVLAAFNLFNESVGTSFPDGKLRASDLSKRLEQLAMIPQPPTMFRTGYLTPFAGNLALNLYYCPRFAASGPFDGFFLQPLVNLQPVAWPLSITAVGTQPVNRSRPGVSIAPLATVMNYFHSCMPDVYAGDKVCNCSSCTYNT